MQPSRLSGGSSGLRPPRAAAATYLLLTLWALLLVTSGRASELPELSSGSSDEPLVAVADQDVFISCVARRLANYTILWRFTNEASGPALNEGPQRVAGSTTTHNDDDDSPGVLLSAGKQLVTPDERFSVIQSHDTWLLKIRNVRPSDTGTYICHTNSEPKVRALTVLSVVRSASLAKLQQAGQIEPAPAGSGVRLDGLDYDFSECCRAEYVVPRCQRLCSVQQLAARYQSMNLVHECFSALPAVTRCMVAGRNLTDCCQKRHIPNRCAPMCGHSSDLSAMSFQDQSYCADYAAPILSCVAEGINTLPGQPEFVIVEAISSTSLKVSWQKVSDESELQKLDGWIIQLTKLSSFEDPLAIKPDEDAKGPSLSSNSNSNSNSNREPTTSASFSVSSTSSSGKNSVASSQTSWPLANLTLVDVVNNSSLAAMTKLLQAASGTISLKLNKTLSEFTIDNLKPYTVYEIQMFAYNSRGRSQHSDPIRALTLSPEFNPDEQESSSASASASASASTNSSSSSSSSSAINSNSDDTYIEPNLPDTRKCCLDRGVTLRRCLDTLCDPVEADRATIADLMICAPWSNVTFGCLASQRNHTECCRTQGVTPFCLGMCSGEVKRLDFRHFRCLTHMSSYTNCILESHDVLPSAPRNFTVGPITHSWAVLNWRPPAKHARSVRGYRIFWRRVAEQTIRSDGLETGSGDSPSNNTATTSLQRSAELIFGSKLQMSADDDVFYSSAEAATSPYLLDGLLPETVYETFVLALNKFGHSEISARFTFQTLIDQEALERRREELEASRMQAGLSGNATSGSPAIYYNETACCVSSGIHADCQSLCDYDIKVGDVSSLVTSCNSQMPAILRCMAGNKNSVPCCRNRGVSDACLNVCAGLTEHSPLVVASRCASDFGKIIRCMDESSKQIPGAPLDLHTADIRPDKLTIKWQPAREDAFRPDIEYRVRYQQLVSSGGPADQVSPTGQADLSSLIAVVPLHPLEHNLILTTNKTEATLDKLKPGARYSIYVTAENVYGISLPSLVLVVQTPTENEDLSSMSAEQLEAYKRRSTLGAPHSLEVLRADTESIVLKWIAPLFISNDAQLRYRVFFKRLVEQESTSNTSNSNQADLNNGSSNSSNVSNSESSDESMQQAASNWTILETSDTMIVLRNLKYSSQYFITVQAYTRQLLGHMSEILLASTARPVPPTLNHPLVIHQPIEGNNITIVCVALGQPTPQISMFINGLLVQKRTQPYVIYHLVNLTRGHLTITCFASNGHGKDYTSVQSRTEVSVRFPAKATSPQPRMQSVAQSTVRLVCDVTGNPEPSVIWTHIPSSGSQSGSNQEASKKVNLKAPSDRVVSQFDNPFSWTHTLILRNVSQADAGSYQCLARNSLAESQSSIEFTLIENPAESSSSGQSLASASANYIKQVELHSDLTECCRSQNVSSKCLPVCSADGLDVEAAFKTAECQPHLDKLMYCAADGSDHRNCCKTRQVPSTCLRWCSGAKMNIPALCFFSSAVDINQCFQEGRTLLPGPPRNLRVLLVSDSIHADDSGGASAELATTTTIGNNQHTNSHNNSSVISSMVMMMGDQVSTSATGSATGANSNEASSSMLHNQGSDSSGSGRAEVNDQQLSEPLLIEWDPPSKNPSLVQYYRIFWRPFGSRELSRTITNSTWIKLSNLNVNKIYEFVVKAANIHGSSVYSDPLTVKPTDVIAESSRLSSGGIAGFIWFLPGGRNGSNVFGRILMAILFATLFMFTSLAIVMLLERRGYLKRFASSKTNSSRISFANPAYLKDSDSNHDNENITWDGSDTGHSLDVLALPPEAATMTPVPMEPTTNGNGFR